MKVTLI